jgi:hypothetical protein
MPRLPVRLAVLLLGFTLISGCGESEPKFGRRPITLDKVPAEIIAAAKKELPGVEIQDAWTNHADGKDAIDSYEVRGRTTATGKIREVRVGLDGKILEKE